MATFNKFNQFVADLANGVHNLGLNPTGPTALKVMLCNSTVTPSASGQTIRSNFSTSELATGSGYTSGGAAIGNTTAGITSTQTSGTYKLVTAMDVTFTSSGTVGPFRYVVLYNSAAASNNLIGWWDYGSDVTLANGETFTVDFDQTNGILQLA